MWLLVLLSNIYISVNKGILIILVIKLSLFGISEMVVMVG